MMYEVDTISLREFLQICKGETALPLITLQNTEGGVFGVFFNASKPLAEVICLLANTIERQENENPH